MCGTFSYKMSKTGHTIFQARQGAFQKKRNENCQQKMPQKTLCQTEVSESNYDVYGGVLAVICFEIFENYFIFLLCTKPESVFWRGPRRCNSPGENLLV